MGAPPGDVLSRGVAPVRTAARTDFASLERLARELHGPDVRLVDGTGATGAVGALDARDRLRFEKGGKPIDRVLGAKRAEDLAFRKCVVDAAYALADSGASFSGSADGDKVNTALWTMGYGGKMGVRKFLADGSLGKPSAALKDIFDNGRAYGFECATAMMVIYHKAILEHVGAEAFDALFTEPRMMSFFRWSIEDDDFADVKTLLHKPTPLRPGSHYYYENVDASPENSAFRGENVIYLGEGKFYAHGVVGASGQYIVTEQELVRSLSSLRRAGATKAPRRIDMEMHLDGLALSKKAVAEPVHV